MPTQPAAKPVPCSIFKAAFLSTAHLSPETCKLMDKWCRSIDLDRREYGTSPVLIGATDTGWFVSVIGSIARNMPQDLFACAKFAKSIQCDLIQFDSEGDQIAQLANLGGPGRLEPA